MPKFEFAAVLGDGKIGGVRIAVHVTVETDTFREAAGALLRCEKRHHFVVVSPKEIVSGRFIDHDPFEGIVALPDPAGAHYPDPGATDPDPFEPR